MTKQRFSRDVHEIAAEGERHQRRLGEAELPATGEHDPVGQVACVLVGWGLAQYPYLVIPDLTLTNAATVPSTLHAMQSALAVGAVVLFPAFGYLYYVFKRRQVPPPGDWHRRRQ